MMSVVDIRTAETPASKKRRVKPLRIRIRLVLATCMALTVALVASTPAFADTIAQKQAQATQVQAQIESLNNKAEIATEKYNTASDRYDSLSKQVSTSNARIKKLKSRTKVLQTHLDTRANDMYRSGPMSFISVLLSVTDFEELDSTIRVLTELNQNDASTVAELKQNKAEEAATNATLVSARANAATQQKAMAANEKAVKEQLDQRSQVLGGLNAEVRDLIAQKKAADEAAAHVAYLALVKRQREAAAAEASKPHSAPRPKPKSSGDSGGDAPTSSKGAAAVYWAMKAIGKPYRWAGSGPNSFDCSGLTSWAYGKAGVSLPHSSGAQISHGPRIAKSNLEPGDLVFFGSPIHHVGMYVGGGDFIEAPFSGASVRVVSLSHRSDFAGACRPK
jgi:cell wall-associated NlpC family hydrolase